MPNPNFPAELGNIPYESVIGGPLNAAVEANARASMTAAQFIRTVGFTTDDSGNEVPVMVEFNYEKQVIDANGNETTERFNMTVPLLLLTHVPYFEVDNVTIDFHAKLNSLQKYATSSEFAVDSSIKGKQGWLTGHVKFSVNVSYQRQSHRQQQIERTYDQQVHVEAGSIESPEGVKKLLGVLEETITEEPAGPGGGGGGGP